LIDGPELVFFVLIAIWNYTCSHEVEHFIIPYLFKYDKYQ
jgi:hypothetical protein